MKKRRGIILAAVLLAILGGLLWLLFPKAEPEPVYQGRSLSSWLGDYRGPAGADPEKVRRDAEDAVRHIGTNAVPTLLRMLRSPDSALTIGLLDLARKQHLLNIPYVLASTRNGQALRAFTALGAEARDAVPALMKIFEEDISLESRYCAVCALGGIGPAAKEAVPFLLRVVTDTNTPDQNARATRRSAFLALGGIHAEPELVVPALTKALSDPDGDVRGSAAWALAHFATEAKMAVPALFERLKDPEPYVRSYAASAIEKIDPEAAAQRKAEIDAALAPVKPQ